MTHAQVSDAVECELFHLDAGTARRLRQSLVATEAAQSLSETFKVLGDPTRVRILDVLSRAELCVCDLAGLVGMSESAVSHQLRLLRSMRLVRARRDGRMVFYALDDDHIVRLFNEGMRHVQESARSGER
jgi:DNA-binding transcriptional ArsR family regulator